MSSRLRRVAIYAGVIIFANLAYGAVTPVAAEEEWGCGRSCHQNGACHAPSGCPYCMPNPLGPIGSCIAA